MPYILSLFFFILFLNLFGLLPGNHAATGALGVTAALALTAFVVVNFIAIKDAGIGSWFHHLLGGAPRVPRTDHGADRDRVTANEAVRIDDPFVREHDGGTHRSLVTRWTHLLLRESRRSADQCGVLGIHLSPRIARCLPSGLHLRDAYIGVRGACSW